jgi:hypothetical protein
MCLLRHGHLSPWLTITIEEEEEEDDDDVGSGDYGCIDANGKGEKASGQQEDDDRNEVGAVDSVDVGRNHDEESNSIAPTTTKPMFAPLS